MAKASLPKNVPIDNLEFYPKPKTTSFRDLEGLRFHRLLVLGYAGRVSRKCRWHCLCDCGSVKKIETYQLTAEQTKSCGCLGRERLLENRRETRTHGYSRTRVHNTWLSMKTRCFNKNLPDYPDYGGRGITVCDRWKDSFENFLEDMGHPPSSQHSIDRIDNNGNYEPANCRWATKQEQSRNRRARRGTLLTFEGQTHTLQEWSCRVTLGRELIGSRVQQGWCARCILTTNIRPGKYNQCTHAGEGVERFGAGRTKPR